MRQAAVGLRHAVRLLRRPATCSREPGSGSSVWRTILENGFAEKCVSYFISLSKARAATSTFLSLPLVSARIKYCSDRCRAAKGGVRPELAEAILQLLGLRARDATICPSEVLPLALKSDRAEMEEVRQAARRLVQEGRIEILQKGRVVDPSTARGPLRLRLKA